MSVMKERATPTCHVLPRCYLFAVTLMVSCTSPAALRVQDPAPSSLVAELRLDLPAALENERVSYRRDIVSARDRVASWFATNGIAVDPAEIINSAVVFADVLEAKRHMSKHFGISEDKIPDGFSGTVDGKTLFVVARETYARTYARLYPDHSWTDDAYQSCPRGHCDLCFAVEDEPPEEREAQVPAKSGRKSESPDEVIDGASRRPNRRQNRRD